MIFVNDIVSLFFALITLVVLYWIVRLAVRHGMRDAFDERDRRD